MDLTALALPVFALLMLTEATVTVLRGQEAYTWRDFGGSMSQLSMNIVVKLATQGLVILLYFFLYQFRLFDIGSGPLQWVFTLVVLDFFFYWYHRSSHRCRFLWCAHVVHHSSQHMNFGTALRQSPTGPLTIVLFYWPLPLLGFHPLIMASAGAVATIYGFWTHTETIGKLWRPIEWLFVTPSHHRAHHGSNPEYIDKNYANLFIIWDRLFGTFEPEVAPIRYGLIKNIDTYNPIKIGFQEWYRLFSETTRARSFQEAFKLWTNPPGWKPGRDRNYSVAASQFPAN
ncbi:MAG: sterol desaturase family protein [Halioglobus sp.]|nr:sterol desaturase family protein [Halioglobus sp.]